MNQIKRTLSLILVLAMVLAAIPAAGAMEINDFGEAEIHTFEGFLKALEDPSVDTLRLKEDLTIEKDVSMPEDRMVAMDDYDLTVPEGVTLTINKDSRIYSHEGKLTINGTIQMNEYCHLSIENSLGGTGSIKGSGVLDMLDHNEKTADGTTPVTYSSVGDVKLDDTVYIMHNLDVTSDRLLEVTRPLNEYDDIELWAADHKTIVIDRPLAVNYLNIMSAYVDDETGRSKVTGVKIVIADGGSLNVNMMLSVVGSQIEVEKGGELTADMISVYDLDEGLEEGASLTVHQGAVFETDTLHIGCVIPGFEATGTVTFCGDAAVKRYIVNDNVLRLGGSAEKYKFESDQNTVITGYVCPKCGSYTEPEPTVPAVEFSDVKEGQWFYDTVQWAVAEGITNGTGSGKFSPDATCTRNQVVTFLWRAAGSPEPTSTTNPFVDVKESDYFYKAVLWAVENGVTTGMDKTHFNPNGDCTRGQVVTFLHRAAGKPAPASTKNPFTDVGQDYYTDAVLWAVGEGITTGMTSTTFAPNATCTRAQIVTFLNRAYT